jgi:hypothetical protein
LRILERPEAIGKIVVDVRGGDLKLRARTS